MATKLFRNFNLAKTFVRLNPLYNRQYGLFTTHGLLYANTKSFTSYIGNLNVSSLPATQQLLLPPGFILQTSYVNYSKLPDDIVSWPLGVPGIEVLEDFTPLEDSQLQQDVSNNINNSLEQGDAGRLFAVVYIRGNQHKVTTEDIILVKYDFPPNVGDKIRLEKVLAVGGNHFSLIGQPLLSRDVVKVEATVVEKTLSHNRVWLVYRKRKNFKKFHLFREMHTILVINSIQISKVPTTTAKEESDNKQELVKKL